MKKRFYYLLYISIASTRFSREQLLELLAKSRVKNERLEITGMLLYKDGVFQQMIEGAEENVKSLFSTIQADARHHGIITILDGYEEERQFPEWLMGFCDLRSAEAAAVPGYTPYMNLSLADESLVRNPTACHRLMMAFRKNKA